MEVAQGRFENSQRVQIEERLLSVVAPLSVPACLLGSTYGPKRIKADISIDTFFKASASPITEFGQLKSVRGLSQRDVSSRDGLAASHRHRKVIARPDDPAQLVDICGSVCSRHGLVPDPYFHVGEALDLYWIGLSLIHCD